MTEDHLPHGTSRVPLILLSGLLCDERIWSEVVPRLNDSCEARVLCFPGFTSIEAMAEHVLASAPSRFALAGHSMGGRVAIEVHRRAPSRVLGMALLNTGIHTARATEPASRGRLVELARTQGLQALADEWLPPMIHPAGAADKRLRSQLNQMVLRNTAESFAGQIRALLDRPEAESGLAAVRVPTLLLSATGDSWSPPAQHAAMRQLLPASRLVIVREAGHMAPAEQPADVSAALNEWLVRVIEADQSSGLSDIDRWVIREQCTRQLYRYARLNDLGSWDALGQLFTESGMLYRPAEPETAVCGRPAIVESFRSRPARQSRHVVSNVEVFVESASRAWAVSSVVLYAGGESAELSATSVGRFHDELRRVQDEWLFAERRGSIALRSTPST